VSSRARAECRLARVNLRRARSPLRARWRSLAALACGLGVGAAAPAARATSCARPDLLDTVPADKATGVPPNASLFAHYDASAEYLGEHVVLTAKGGMPEVVKVEFQDTQGLLTFAPPEPLAPGDYTLAWPGLRGLNVGSPGRGVIVTFTVGSNPDVAPPTFDGLTGIGWDLERRNNDCTGSLENRMRFDLTLGPADDDGGRDGLTLVVFQTAGGAVDGGPVPVLTQAMPAAGAQAQVRLPVADATGHVCFSALAQDLTGKNSNGASHEVCVETTAPPFFRGCAVAPARVGQREGRATATLGIVSILFVLGTLGARSRRPRRRRSRMVSCG
jgi:hypothetical protein